MSNQTAQPIVLDSEQLKQLKDEIDQEMHDILNNTNLRKVLGKYGLSQEEVLTIEYSIDTSKIQLSDAVPNQQFNQSVPADLGKHIQLLGQFCYFDHQTKKQKCI